MNEKKAKAVRRGVRRMLEHYPDMPDREYVLMPEGFIVLTPGCKRTLYKVAKTVARGFGRHKLGPSSWEEKR